MDVEFMNSRMEAKSLGLWITHLSGESVLLRQPYLC